ncbi:MAG: protein kinase domain-containing protein, partial [Polyangiaceae bacterium]
MGQRRPCAWAQKSPQLTSVRNKLQLYIGMAVANSTDRLAIAASEAVWRRLDSSGPSAVGAVSEVWRVRHVQTGKYAALKIAMGGHVAERALAREAILLARVRRRWGPALLDVGPGFLVLDWVEGAPLDSLACDADDRERLATVIAHAVGRALEELHQAGVHHGDVKPENVLLARSPPTCDAASDRGATLVDL